jgi:hypothetical protein
MNKDTMIRLRSFLVLALSVRPVAAQTQPAPGLYQIVSGTYTTCCGIAGASKVSLPNQDQAFFRLSIDPQNNVPQMTFLDQVQTIFTVSVCAPNDPIEFSFGYGLVLSDSIVFHVDPGPPPEHLYWNYTVSNSAGGLRIDGMVGIDSGACSDVPNQFSHSNVVAFLVPQPRITITEFSSDGPLLMIQGQTGRTNVLEASTDFMSWTPLRTNVMPNTDCPICPFITFRDNAATNLTRRFYRSFEIY